MMVDVLRAAEGFELGEEIFCLIGLGLRKSPCHPESLGIGGVEDGNQDSQMTL